MAEIILASSLSRYANDSKKFQYDGSTLGDVLSVLCKTHRELGKFIYATPSELHPFINIFVDNKNAKELGGLSTEIGTQSTVRVLPGISGG